MAEREKRIREALEAVPLPHEWAVCQEPANPYWFAGRTIGAADPADARRVADTCELDHNADKFAAYIAACNPAAIRALLADLDAVRATAKKLVDAVNYKAVCMAACADPEKIDFANECVWKAVDQTTRALKGATA